MIRQGDFIILDTETTGLEDGEICQIAIVNHDGSILIDTLVKPSVPIPARATAIHGITNPMVVDAPAWSAIAPQVVNLLNGRNVVAYNAIFDRKMLHRSAEAGRLPKTDWKTFSHWWCAMEAFSAHYGQAGHFRRGYRYQSLQTAAKHYQIAVERAHTALDDCMTTLAVVRAMAAEKTE
jgi:DNA polymerase-3 subunit epsilon